MSDKSVDLVLEGGGVKGIGLLGAVLTLAGAGYRFERIAGPSAGAIDAFAAFVRGGAHSGDYLFDWLTPLLRDRGVTTFKDLRIPDSGGSLEDYQKYSPVVHASDLSRGVLMRLPWDYAKYGLVADAVRASMAIPFFFRPVQVTTQEGVASRTVYVDTSGVPATDFDITKDDQTRLFTNGQRAATRFLENLPLERQLSP